MKRLILKAGLLILKLLFLIFRLYIYPANRLYLILFLWYHRENLAKGKANCKTTEEFQRFVVFYFKRYADKKKMVAVGLLYTLAIFTVIIRLGVWLS